MICSITIRKQGHVSITLYIARSYSEQRVQEMKKHEKKYQ